MKSRLVRISVIATVAVGLSACMGPINRNVMIGHQAFLAKDYAKAFAYYRSAASYDSPAAEYSLGYLYYFGLGVATNQQQAINWWSKSANWNYAPAKNALAQLDRNLPIFQD